MTTNHFIALLKTFLLTFISGIIFMLIATLLYYNILSNMGVELVAGFFASFVTAIMMCALWLPAITIIDKQNIKKLEAVDLFNRHLPIVTIPFIITFVVMYFADETPTELSIIVFEIMFTAFASLYIYFRLLKSKGFIRDDASVSQKQNNSGS